MPRSRAKSRSTAEFRFPVPVKVTRARFKLSPAFRHIDPRRVASRAKVEIEIGSFEGQGCGSTVTAIVKKGMVVRLDVTPCAETRSVPRDRSLKTLLAAARQRLGGSTRPRKFKAVPFAKLQEEGDGGITISGITCIQICIYGHCIVCCSLVAGGFWCGKRVIIES